MPYTLFVVDDQRFAIPSKLNPGLQQHIIFNRLCCYRLYQTHWTVFSQLPFTPSWKAILFPWTTVQGPVNTRGGPCPPRGGHQSRSQAPHGVCPNHHTEWHPATTQSGTQPIHRVAPSHQMEQAPGTIWSGPQPPHEVGPGYLSLGPSHHMEWALATRVQASATTWSGPQAPHEVGPGYQSRPQAPYGVGPRHHMEWAPATTCSRPQPPQSRPHKGWALATWDGYVLLCQFADLKFK